MEYRLVLDVVVLHFVLAQRVSDRLFLLRAFELLSRDPYRRGDLQARDAEGRFVEVLQTGRFLVTFWADHAVKELRIMRVEKLLR